MITIQLDTTDLESFRFAYSPMIELVSSFKLLHNPDRYGIFGAWVDEALRALDGLDLPYMQAVILNHYYIADFVTQTPTKPRMTLDEEFELIRSTPPELVRRDLDIVIEASEESEIRHHFQMVPHDAVECLLAEMELYWNRVLAHHWPRIQTVLENDILFRAREMALYGVDSMFTNLNPYAQYMTGQLLLNKPYLGRECNLEVSLEGRGLQLVPAMFRGGAYKISWQVVPEYLPMIIYGARGAGLWYAEAQPDPEAALTLMLGEGKAKLLQALKTPSHTSELAHRLSITAGAVSQQLGRMNQAGLVESHRSSSKVYYRLTSRGEKLLTLFTE
jgi:DNA-binding HxlR family transcriptional regulator